jgi:hypothetical protein
MLQKEWITNANGQIEAIWVQNDQVRPAKYDFAPETSINETQSREPLSDRHRAARISAAIHQFETLRASASQPTLIHSAKDGHWNKFYTILKSILP